MILPQTGVIVKEVRPAGSSRQAAEFVRELADMMARTVRPCVVLDCAPVRRIDSDFLHLLLCCLEEAMKRNGDVRLAGLPEGARRALKSLGIERLFQFFPGITEAAGSYRRPAALPSILAARQNRPYPSDRAA